jgi:hypothetical protein
MENKQKAYLIAVIPFAWVLLFKLLVPGSRFSVDLTNLFVLLQWICIAVLFYYAYTLYNKPEPDVAEEA